jgi:hypothetical protein
MADETPVTPVTAVTGVPVKFDAGDSARQAADNTNTVNRANKWAKILFLITNCLQTLVEAWLIRDRRRSFLIEV